MHLLDPYPPRPPQQSGNSSLGLRQRTSARLQAKTGTHYLEDLLLHHLPSCPRAYFGTLRVSVEYRNRPAMAQTRGSLAHDRGRIQSHGGERNDSGGGCIQSHPLRDESSRHRIASQPSPTQLQLGARYDFCLLALTCPCPNSTPTQSNSSRYD